MSRYLLVFLIISLFTPTFATAASPSTSLTREQQIRALQKEIRMLLTRYQELLAQKSSERAIVKGVAATSVKTTPTTYNAPVMMSGTSDLEDLVLEFTNDARRENGLASLSSDPALIALARGHSEDMLANNYFNHSNLSGCNSICRMNKSGYSWQKMGENIHKMSGYTMSDADTAEKIVNDWLNSPSHRANLLNPAFTKAGIGIAQKGVTIYSTTEYALPL